MSVNAKNVEAFGPFLIVTTTVTCSVSVPWQMGRVGRSRGRQMRRHASSVHAR